MVQVDMHIAAGLEAQRYIGVPHESFQHVREKA
jgi:hypothetical protein